MKHWVLYFLTVLMVQICTAQSASLLADGGADFIRRTQLTGALNSNSSLLINTFNKNETLLDSLLNIKPLDLKYNKFKIELLQLNRTAQFNSEFAYGSNDGAMIPSKGMQWVVGGGFKASWGDFTLRIKPEYITAQNLPFETFPTEHYPAFWKQYYRWLNTIDHPENFGTNS